jgi:hypothetical protein
MGISIGGISADSVDEQKFNQNSFIHVDLP